MVGKPNLQNLGDLRNVYIRVFLWLKDIWILANNMLLLTNCEVHTGKYLDRSFEVRTERKAKVQIFFRMDRTNWSIRTLLYSYNQHLGFIPDKMILN